MLMRTSVVAFAGVFLVFQLQPSFAISLQSSAATVAPTDREQEGVTRSTESKSKSHDPHEYEYLEACNCEIERRIMDPHDESLEETPVCRCLISDYRRLKSGTNNEWERVPDSVVEEHKKWYEERSIRDFVFNGYVYVSRGPKWISLNQRYNKDARDYRGEQR